MTPMHSKNLIAFRNLRFSYDASWMLLVDQYVIAKREVHIIVGNNMSGKSTFINIIAGLQSVANKDAISFDGNVSKDFRSFRETSMILSNSDNMFPEFSIWDNIRVAIPRCSRAENALRMKAASAFLNKSNIFSRYSLDSPLFHLSSGGRTLVKLCRGHVARVPLIVIDELTSYLDDKRAAYFLDEILSLANAGTAVLVVSHNLRDREYLAAQARNMRIPCRCASITRDGDTSIVRQNDVE